MSLGGTPPEYDGIVLTWNHQIVSDICMYERANVFFNINIPKKSVALSSVRRYAWDDLTDQAIGHVLVHTVASLILEGGAVHRMVEEGIQITLTPSLL